MNKIRNTLKNFLSLLSVGLHYNRKSKVLYLHDIHKSMCYAIEDCSMPLDAFFEMIKIIKDSGFFVVKEITEKKDQVRICFDDGYRGIWDCHDELISNGIYPTVFVATSLIGKDQYLTSDEIVQLCNKGFLIQSHTVSHKPLTSFDEYHLKKELIDSKTELEHIIHKDVEEICLPLGCFNEDVLTVASLVYKRVFLSLPGAYWDELDHGIVYRILCQNLSLSSIRFALIGGQDIFCPRIRKQHYQKNVKIDSNKYGF